MKSFKRGLYNEKIELDFLEYLARIEKIYEYLLQMPKFDKVRFISEDIVMKWVEEKNYEMVMFSLIYEVYNRLKFMLYTNVFKTIKLIEGLIMMYNSKNYIGWTLFGRSVIEHSAIFYYYLKKLQNINLLRNTYTLHELKQIEDILIKYTNGSRFDWDTLLSGNIDKLTEKYKPDKHGKEAVNVLTALSHLSRESIFKNIKIIYSMFSDFAHPNMASHSIFINLTQNAIQSGENELALDVNEKRGEFIIVATLEPITYNLENIVKLTRDLSKIL